MAQEALDWQQTASHALLWEAGAAAQGGDENRTYSLAGQMAAVGEQLGLAYSSGVEVALWREIRASSKEVDPVHEMGTRAMAEAQSYFIMGAAHGLANVALYSLMQHSALRQVLASEFRRKAPPPPFEPFSSDRRDWISMNRDNAKRMTTAAQTLKVREVDLLVKAIASFAASTAWADLNDRRGEDFHRWRPQTHGLAGVAKKGPWTRPSKGTRALGVGPVSNYSEAQGLADEVADTADAAMLRLSEAMHDFFERFIAASEHLTGPKFRSR